MSLYESVSLGKVCDILDRYRKPITKRDRVSGPYPYYGVSGILDHVADYIFDEPLVLVGEDGAKWGIGESSAFAIDGKTWVNNHAHVLRPHRAHLVDDWLVHSLNAIDLTPFISGITVPKLNQTRLKEISIPLPPLNEQRRIVGILNRAAKIERLRKQAQERLQELIPALFVRMFGDPVENPMGWEEARICDLGAVGSGAGFPKKEQGVQGEEFPFLKVGDMNLPGNEVVIQSWNNTISRSTRENLRAKLFPAGSVIFPKIGAAIATNKKRMLIWPSCVDNNVMAIVPDTTSMNSEYLYGLMLHKNLGDFASASAPPSMRKTTVENWCVPNPPLSIQSQYAEIVESARDTAMRAYSVNRTTESLNSSLMSGLLKADT